MPEKVRIKHQVIPVPHNLEEAAGFLQGIGQEQREIEKIQAKLNEKVDKLKVEAVVASQRHEAKINQLVEGLFAFGESNRDNLTEGGKKKTVDLPTGWFGWRTTPPSVNIRDTQAVLARLKEAGLEQFIRTKEEPDKEAMLKEQKLAKTIKGISIIQREEFVVKPVELEIEITSSAEKLRKAKE